MIADIIKTAKQRLRSKMAGDVIWTFAAQMVVLLSAFALNKVLSSRVDVDTFGEYNIIKRSATVISFIMLAGTGIAVPRYMALYIGDGKPRRAKSFVIAAILLMLTAIVVVSVAALILKEQLTDLIVGRDDTLLYVTALMYSLTLAASTFLFVYFRGKNDFKLSGISNALIQILLPVSALIIPGINTLNLFVWWTIITAVSVLLFAIFEIKKGGIVVNEKCEKSEIIQEYKTAAKYSVPRLWGDFFLFAFQAFPLIFISKYYDLASVSYYSVGITIVTLATAFYSFLGMVLLPYVSECLARGMIKDAVHKINVFTFIYIASAVAVIGLFYVVTEYLITLLFTSEYLPAEGITQIMILAILPQSIYLLYRNPIDAVSVFPFNTLNVGISFGALVGAFYCVHTIESLAWAYVGVSVLQGLLSFIVWKIVKKRV
ncbi:MAG: lipopolysaccharide biosynthesis protein [Bacteroidales bacterium]|nr:lipopolysaccharide biosynthesis protein [Bacteroidales bacterium]